MNELYTIVEDSEPQKVIDLSVGKRFRKQLVKYGVWAEPGNRKTGKMVLDAEWGKKIKANFDSKVIGRLPLPLGHPKNDSDMATLNRGEVVSIDASDPDGLWGEVEVRDEATAKDIEEGRLWDTSISFDNQYVDTKTGQMVGPTALHVGLVNDPYLPGMQPFQALSNGVKQIMLSRSEEPMATTKKITNNRDFVITVKYKDGDEEKEVKVEPGQSVDVPEAVLEDATKQLTEAQAPKKDEPVKDKPKTDEPQEKLKDDPKKDEAAEALREENRKLKEQLSRNSAEKTFSELLHEGKVVPAQKEMFLSLSAVGSTTINLSNGATESLETLMAKFLKAGPKRIDLSENGNGGEGDGTPYDELSESEKAALDKMGTSPDDYNKSQSDSKSKNRD